MRKSGTVVRWDDARGFGFIRGEGKGQDVFLHARDFLGSQGQAPCNGMTVSFDEVHVDGKGPRAVSVKQVGAEASVQMNRPQRARPHAPNYKRRVEASDGSGGAIAPVLMLAYATALVYAVWAGDLPWWVLPASAGVNQLAFFAYWIDRDAAYLRQSRIPEYSLHLWSLAGGWGGAWMAQQLLRHKTGKRAFLAVYWLTVVVHIGAVGGWFWWFSSAIP